MKIVDMDEKQIGVGILFDGPEVAIYMESQFQCSFGPSLARDVARRMLEMADLIDPPKKETP